MKGREAEAAEALVWLYGEDNVQGIQEELNEVKKSVEEDMR